VPEKDQTKTFEQLQHENKELLLRLKETEETLVAIRNGEVDAIIVSGDNGDKIFSISSSETPYRTILEEMDEGAVTVSSDGTILYFNKSFAEIVSVPAERISGSDFSDLMDPEERPLFRKLLKSGQKKKVRSNIKCKNLHLRLSLVPISTNIEGEICIIVTDITEIQKYQDKLKDQVKERSSELKIANRKLTEDLLRLKKAGKELRESEKKFKQLANSIPQLAWISRPDGYRIWFNQRWYDYTGSNYKSMRGWGWHSVHDPIVLPRVINRWKNCVAEDKPFEMIFPLRAKNGLYRIFLSRGIPIRNTSGKVVHWFGTNTDISDLKKVEKELENSKKKLTLALENGNIGMWEWHIRTNEMVWDERMKKMLTIENKVFDSKYPTFEKFINDEDIPHFREAINNTLKYNMPFETVFRTHGENGESKYISTKALLSRTKNGKPVSLSGVCFDITSMKKGSEQVLIKLNEELLRSNRDLQQFAYVASHDLQEPLRMVSSFTQLLALRYEDKLDQDAREFIRFAVDGAKRMYDLLNGLLAYSRVQSKGREFSKVKMNDVLEKVLQNLALKIVEKKASISIGKLPVLFADESQMIQLVQNLIENSIKFSINKPVISISAKLENDYYKFSVKDKGVGIESQYYERIFQIFQRLQPKATHEGTGIGLAICKRIIERHKGRIWLESEPGKGSIFFFTIPV
jgi:two-component system, chemotaxis family, sensor kinase Cph1